MVNKYYQKICSRLVLTTSSTIISLFFGNHRVLLDIYHSLQDNVRY